MAKNRSEITDKYGMNFKEMAERYGKHPAWYCMVYGLGRWLGRPNLLKNVLAKLEREKKGKVK